MTKTRFLGHNWEIPKKIKGWNHTFQLAKPYIKENGIGIDVGCREGGFAREMENDFTHIHCFDFRNKRKMAHYTNGAIWKRWSRFFCSRYY